MGNSSRGLILISIIHCLLVLNINGQYSPDWDSLDSRPLPDWYDKAKFGIFIHWGVFSVPSYGCEPGASGAEWYWNYLEKNIECVSEYHNKTYGPQFTYPEFAPMFDASLFNANEWAALFKAAGARYVVFTSKHHDGFTNWKSPQSWNWNSVDTGPHQDNVGLITDAVKNAGLHMGLYHSLYEWFNPLYLEDFKNNGTTDTYVVEILLPMLYDIVNTYQPDILWADGDWSMNSSYWKAPEFIAWLYNESPVKDTICINDRWGSDCECKHGGYFTCEDRYNPGHALNHKWENCMTIDGGSWGFSRNTNISGYLTIEEILSQLITTVSCGGNLLLNVGPSADGTIHPIFQERLLQVGSWLSVNGESIYETVPWRAQNDTISNVWYTSINSNDIYAILLSWPVDNILRLSEPIPFDNNNNNSTRVELVGYNGGELKWSYSNNIMEIILPTLTISQMPCQWAWSIRLRGVK